MSRLPWVELKDPDGRICTLTEESIAKALEKDGMILRVHNLRNFKYHSSEDEHDRDESWEVDVYTFAFYLSLFHPYFQSCLPLYPDIYI